MKKLLVAIIALTLIGTTFAKIAPKKPAPKPLATICKNIGTKKEGLYYMNGKLAKLVKCAPKKVENPKEPVKQNTGNTTINNIPSGYGYSYITWVVACTMDYTPVCASVQVQCIKAPCPPISQTFGNLCTMKANKLAKFLYTGACKTIK